MKKFVFMATGFETPTQEIMDAWSNWFASMGDRIIDHGSPFKSGRELTHDGIKEIPLDKDAITGYMIVQAKDMDEAMKIAQGCPIISGLRVYETVSM